MNVELFYLYDTHCPWSYATTALVNEVATALPEIKINLLHCARYDGEEGIESSTIEMVQQDSNKAFGQSYLANYSLAKDSTIAANLMTWAQLKTPHQALALLNDIQNSHFQQANEFNNEQAFTDIISKHKLSPPSKIYNIKKFTKDVEATLAEADEFQDIIATTAIPALLLAVGDNLVLLNHNLYLKSPKAIVDAIKLELN